MPHSLFYDLPELEQIAVNLFYGWGYNFYRVENQLRADDQLIRTKTGWLLGLALKSIATAESAYRRDALPPPSRANPRPDPEAVAGARALERMAQTVSALEGQVRAQPSPENDRMSERYRAEGPTLLQLIDCDKHLVGQAEVLRAMLEHKPAPWMLENATQIAEGVEALTQTLRLRAATLLT